MSDPSIPQKSAVTALNVSDAAANVPKGAGREAIKLALLNYPAVLQILDYFEQHPDELTRIAALPQASATEELKKLAPAWRPEYLATPARACTEAQAAAGAAATTVNLKQAEADVGKAES
jgi:hypothetical protein